MADWDGVDPADSAAIAAANLGRLADLGAAVVAALLVEWHSISDKTTQLTGWTEADYADPSNQNRQITSRLNPGNEKAPH